MTDLMNVVGERDVFIALISNTFKKYIPTYLQTI